MHSRSATFIACVTACTVFAVPQAVSASSALSVTVVDVSGAPVEGAVVVAEPTAGPPKPPPGQKAIMDQRNLAFVPGVLVVQTGTAVDFPNSDQVRHQVYSFSEAKPFQLGLYAGGRTLRWCLSRRPGDARLQYSRQHARPTSTSPTHRGTGAPQRTAHCDCAICPLGITPCGSGTTCWMSPDRN